ncbi:IS4 family transposase [Pontibacter aydingkolensis]
MIQRSGKLGALDFLQLCLLCAHSACSKSLTQLCASLQEKVGVCLSKQSLDARFSAAAVAFLKACVADLLTLQPGWRRSTLTGKASAFSRVRLGDSTVITLPEQLAAHYRGSGGSASASAAKLFHEYDCQCGALLSLQLAEGVKADQSFNSATGIEAGELVIRDLGFYQMDFLCKVHQAKAFFISRLRSGTCLFQQGQQVCFQQLIKGFPPQLQLWEVQASIGGKASERETLGQVRLVIERVPQQVYEQRVRRLHQTARRKGRQVSQEQLLWHAYQIYITNAAVENLPAAQLRHYYGLRWQIELVFKTWKSVWKIAQLKPMQVHRLECMLPGTLLLVLLAMPLLYLLKIYLWQKQQREVSEWKAMVWLTEHVEAFVNSILLQKHYSSARQFFNYLTRDGLKERRKKNGNYTHNIPFSIVFAP